VDTRQDNFIGRENLEAAVGEVLDATAFIDIHTHLFPITFGDYALWGIDDLLTYHYLEAEMFRCSPIRPEEYFDLSKSRRADLVWRTLFVENSPLSEACCGVITVLNALGLGTRWDSLGALREFFAAQQPGLYLEKVLAMAGVSDVVMTNDPLDSREAGYWESNTPVHPRFHAALRLDRILNEWDSHHEKLSALGYNVQADARGSSPAEVRRFLRKWIQKMNPLYLAVSLPDSFFFPAEDTRTVLLKDAVLAECRESGLPVALMIGVRRRVNPALRGAGDAAGKANLIALENLCAQFPDNRFLVSVLSRENQHELCIYARKFRNLLPFGCWWFLNNPSIVEEITRERLEMLGTSFIPQHSDARVLDQLIYKWRSTRRTLAPILAKTYRQLADAGRVVARSEIERDIARLFRGNFERLTGRTLHGGIAPHAG
jgi:hypothetical protein